MTVKISITDKAVNATYQDVTGLDFVPYAP